MADEPENLVLTLPRQLDAKVDRMGAELASVKTDVRVYSRWTFCCRKAGYCALPSTTSLRKTSLRAKWKPSTTTSIACGMKCPSLRFGSK
jgi:hypothetical protein